MDGGAALFDEALAQDGAVDGAVVENDVWAEVLQTRLLARGLKIPLVVLANASLPRHFALPVTRIYAPRKELEEWLGALWDSPEAGNPEAARKNLAFSLKAS